MPSSEQQHIVIVGAGIIGVCTAYYLTQHPDFDNEKYRITIIEARRPASGASGKAGGLLAMWAFPQQIVPLSFQLHQELSDRYNGEQEWGYRRLNTMSIEGTLGRSASSEQKSSSTSSSAGGYSSSSDSNDNSSNKSNAGASEGGSNALPRGLDWIRSELVDGWSSLGDTDITAQVHPYKFTTFILRKVLQTNAAELVIGKVTKLKKDPKTGEVIGVIYEKSGQSDEKSDMQSEDKTEAAYSSTTATTNPASSASRLSQGSDPSSEEKEIELRADKIVLTLGPWTSKILHSCPISGLRAHSITIKPTREVSPFAMFTELKVKRGHYVSPEIYPRKEEVYICGEGDASVPTPETSDDVQVDKKRCDDLVKYAGEFSAELQNGKVLRRQACYLPVTDVASCSGPFIGQTNVDNLYIASGHSCWGINNAPATGKLMAEILLEGKAHSANLSGLEPEFFFDAHDFAY